MTHRWTQRRSLPAAWLAATALLAVLTAGCSPAENAPPGSGAGASSSLPDRCPGAGPGNERRGRARRVETPRRNAPPGH